MKQEHALEIEKRAYELFLARGGQEGYHLEDWLQAEKEICGKAKKASTPKKATTSKKTVSAKR